MWICIQFLECVVPLKEREDTKQIEVNNKTWKESQRCQFKNFDWMLTAKMPKWFGKMLFGKKSRHTLSFQLLTFFVLYLSRVTRLGYFCWLGYFLKFIVIFWKDVIGQENGNNLGYFLAEPNLLKFHLNRQFQNMICCRKFKVSKVVWQRCFKLSNLALM